MPIKGGECHKASQLRGAQGKESVESKEISPFPCIQLTRQRDKCTDPSPTGDVDGFQPFEAEGIAGGMLYRNLYKMDVILYCVRLVAYAEVIRIPRAKLKPGGRRSPFS